MVGDRRWSEDGADHRARDRPTCRIVVSPHIRPDYFRAEFHSILFLAMLVALDSYIIDFDGREVVQDNVPVYSWI